MSAGTVRIVSHDAIYYTVEARDASGALQNDADWTDLATAQAFAAWLQNAANDANLSGLYADVLRDAVAAMQVLSGSFATFTRATAAFPSVEAIAALREVTERARHATRALGVKS
jgi:hypothetical protein